MQRLKTCVALIAVLASMIAPGRAGQAPSLIRLPEPKDRFVGALRQFLEAIAGQYGDEQRASGAAIDSMELALAEWDQAVRADEDAAASQAPTAALRGALGLMYLDRRRIEDALREFAAATRLDPRRADLQMFRGFAYDLLDKPVEATAAFAEAAALDPSDPTGSYRLARHLAGLGQAGAEGAVKARQLFRESQQQNLATARADPISAPPFIRVDLLRQAANVAPIFPPARYADGFAALRQGRYADAVSRFREAAGGDPLRASDAGSQARLAASAALRQGQLTAALAQLRRAAAAAPNVAETHRLLGMAYFADDQHDEAMSELAAAIGLHSDDERARLALAEVMSAAGRLPDAEQALKDAIQAVPGSGQAHYSLGRLYEFQQKWPEAALMFHAAANLNPVVGLDRLYQTIARMHLSLPDLDGAIEAATTRVDVNPNNADAHRALGDLLLRQGRHDEALTELLAALLINPRDAESYGGIAQVHVRTGRFHDAVAASRRALEIDPQHNPARYTLATALIRIGRAEDGAKELERFQQVQKELQLREERELELKMLQQEVSATLVREDYDAAIAALRKMIPFEPDSSASHLNLGVVLKKSGRLGDAVESLTKALELKAGPDVHRLLAEVYEALGQLEEGRKHRALYERSKEERLRQAGWTR